MQQTAAKTKLPSPFSFSFSPLLLGSKRAAGCKSLAVCAPVWTSCRSIFQPPLSLNFLELVSKEYISETIEDKYWAMDTLQYVKGYKNLYAVFKLVKTALFPLSSLPDRWRFAKGKRTKKCYVVSLQRN